METGAVLLSGDSHFDVVDGLLVWKPGAELIQNWE